MADNIEIDPDKLAKAADLPEQVSKKVHSVVRNLADTLSGIESDSANQPWGNDKFGKKFADGDKGYKATRKDMIDGGYNMAAALHSFAEGERQAAEDFTAAEQSSVEGLGGQ